ncbi:MAG: DASS family sodium-coupled anion symporter [Proteobacteria bacterium]|nr:DASS family sodium-coupled anion symporter [Pseudomonadota bacterium]NOG61119.1 DASS family sodium-coupled anion symporter [Pseudomonadota bacterium]
MIKNKNIGLATGLLLFIVILLFPTPESLPLEAKHVLAVAALMASWWVTEAIPIPATALLPILLFPILGVMSGTEVTQPYAHHLIYLFLGGFLIAVTIEKWNLHRRIALYTIELIGVTPRRIILGFMIASASLSMWISNTAATMMMVTIGLAVLKQVVDEIERDPDLHIDTSPKKFRFGIALMLGIAYAASIGGIATLIGTPPNAIMAGVIETHFNQNISFLNWMIFALPLSVTMLFITWYYLTHFAFPSEIEHLPGGKETIEREIDELGKMSRQEKTVLLVFGLVAILWITRGFIKVEAFKFITDSTIAMAGALLLFIIPSNLKKGEFLLDWKTACKIPWDILILFGGGFALAKGFTDSGLTQVIANQLDVLQGSNLLLIIIAVTTVVIILTEITSNTATASMFLPIIAALAVAMYIHPYTLMIAVALAASFAFMLPVATPPNAIAFSSHYFTIRQMARTGIWLNLIGVILISLFVKFYLPLVWGIDINELPENIAIQTTLLNK